MASGAAMIAAKSQADQLVMMAAQEQIAQSQRMSMLKTTAIQKANAETAAFCNMILDGVKAINELMKKGGAAMVSAIGQ